MNKRENMVEKDSQAYYERQLSVGRSAILLVLMLTVINLAMVLLGADFYLLFSASVPYYLTVIARGFDLAASGGANQAYTWAALGVSAVVLGLYLLCWILSRKQPNWLVVSLVLFILDTVCLALFCLFVFGGFMESIVDFLMHGWVIYEVVIGIRAAHCLKDGEYTI